MIVSSSSDVACHSGGASLFQYYFHFIVCHYYLNCHAMLTTNTSIGVIHPTSTHYTKCHVWSTEGKYDSQFVWMQKWNISIFVCHVPFICHRECVCLEHISQTFCSCRFLTCLHGKNVQQSVSNTHTHNGRHTKMQKYLFLPSAPHIK